MNVARSTWIRLLWTIPVAAAGLAIFFLFASGSVVSTCKAGVQFMPQSTCERSSAVPVSSAADQMQATRSGNTLRPTDAVSFGNQFPERRIRMLNDMDPLPEPGIDLLDEIDRLLIQERRFERRYGDESVAVRSVRDRLRRLHQRAATGAQYAVQEEPEAANH